LGEQGRQRELVQQIPLVQMDALAQVGDAFELLLGGPAHHPVHLVPLLQEELRQVAAVLPGDAGDQRSLWHGARSLPDLPFMGLTEAQRAHLHGEGWLRLEQVLTPAQVREMNAAWDRWQERVGPEKVGG